MIIWMWSTGNKLCIFMTIDHNNAIGDHPRECTWGVAINYVLKSSKKPVHENLIIQVHT